LNGIAASAQPSWATLRHAQSYIRASMNRCRKRSGFPSWSSFAFLSKTTDAIFAPYDGGADGFSLDAPTMLRLSKEFQSWRSAHPRGL